MKKNILTLSAITALFMFSCQNTELEERVASLEEKVENISAQSLINNPTTINNPNQQVEVNGPVAAIQMDVMDHNFGKITDGDVVSHKFSFTNTGENPLIISNASGSCGCTVPEFPKEPIAPGAKGEILVKFDSKGKIGNQRKSVTVTANTNPATTQFFINAEVLPAAGSPITQ